MSRNWSVQSVHKLLRMNSSVMHTLRDSVLRPGSATYLTVNRCVSRRRRSTIPTLRAGDADTFTVLTAPSKSGVANGTEKYSTNPHANFPGCVTKSFVVLSAALRSTVFNVWTNSNGEDD
eukprot:COSAG02_NODE_1387_length_12938_cov_24.292235_2_plen_120_part_00